MTRSPRLARVARAVRLGALLLATAILSACAHHAAKGAATGVVSAAQEMNATLPDGQNVVGIVSAHAVEGAVGALDQPEQRAKVQKLIDAAVANAVTSALRAALTPPTRLGAEGGGENAPAGAGPAALLAGQIGRVATEDALGRVAVQLSGQGPLRANLVSTSASATDAAVGAALTDLFPGCPGDGAEAAACRRRQIQSLTRATAASISAGMRDSFAWPLLLLAAGLGLSVGVLVHWGVSLRRRPYTLPPV
jgi:hypothetical protein